jgi:hypothetical protein
MIPGTSCLATIVLSLRDKRHAPIEAPHNNLSGGSNPGNRQQLVERHLRGPRLRCVSLYSLDCELNSRNFESNAVSQFPPPTFFL